MKSLIVIKDTQEFNRRYPSGYVPSTDIVVLLDEDKLVLRTTNVDGTDIQYTAKFNND